MKVHVVIDVEMCKVRTKIERFPHKNEIIQIGAVMMNEAYEIMDEFSTYVKPRYGRIDHFIMTLTGISERTIKDAPDIEEALEQMLRWIGEKEVTFYSWSATDYYQIRKEITGKCDASSKWEILLDQSNWIDYQKSFAERVESKRDYKLADALQLAEVNTKRGEHDGLVDAYNTASMISKLEIHKDYRTLLERVRENEKQQEPLTISLGSLLKGFILETA